MLIDRLRESDYTDTAIKAELVRRAKDKDAEAAGFLPEIIQATKLPSGSVFKGGR
jgi:hypothetical protein